MSNRSDSKGPIPARWLHCPRKAVKLIRNKFLAFKTPLSSAFDNQVPEDCRFSVDMLFSSLKSQNIKIGLWIDLTNTSRFYEKQTVEKHGCSYLKLPCRGHEECPSPDQTNTFVQVCKNFIAQNPLSIIGVHCTHGFNRTGFLTISYLVESSDTSVNAALAEFANARSPGIYKADYIQELYRRYGDVVDAPEPAPRPAWCLEYDDSNVQDADKGHKRSHRGNYPPAKKRKREFNRKNPVFMAGVPGVTAVLDQRKISGIQRRVQNICSRKNFGFPGSQPVSMDFDNIRYLNERPYRVSWKADGTRYMMLIQADGEVYFIDRDNSIFQVEGLTFPHPNTNRLLKDTLLDGEMVIERVDNKECPRYLAYDVVMYDGEDVSQRSFYPDRYDIIEKKIIHAKHKAYREGRIKREREPFSVRLKEFWNVTQADSLLSEKFTKQLGHEPDGLIFQPAKEPYTTGPSPLVLKWKPLSMNSVNFRLRIVTDSGEGILPREIGQLYVGGLLLPFGLINVNEQMSELNNSIIECKYENNQWIFMRERADKSFPNSMNTAQSVYKSIGKPITHELLVDFINNNRFIDEDADLMPRPNRKGRYHVSSIEF